MSSKIDVETLKRSTPLTLVVTHYLGAPVKSNARGAWWCCPFHTEKSASFLVGGRPDRAQEYHCFGCGQHGDALEFIKFQERLGNTGLDFVTACEKLASIGGQSLPTGAASRTSSDAPLAPSGPPSATWQGAARAFVKKAQTDLWGPFGAGCLRYLREQRGLTEETIREFGLGWNVATYKAPQAEWGMPDREKPVWLPQGLVIPGEVNGALWYVKIRPSAEVHKYFEPKYYQLPAPDGERSALLGVDRWRPGLPVLLCEGEMDLFTVWQTARDLVNAGTLGGAAKGRAGRKLNFGRWLFDLSSATRILLAYDPDAAGTGAAEAFGRISARFEPVSVPFGADINAFYVAGGDVAGWLHAVSEQPSVVSHQPSVVSHQPSEIGAWPKTFVFPHRSSVPFINGQWRQLDDGRIEATFMDAEELQIVLDAAKAIANYESQMTS